MPEKKETKAQKAVGSEHILLKVRSESGQTITAHADMVAAKGTAMLGKIGQAVGSDFRDMLNQQIERGFKTYLFLTIREGWNGPYVTYRSLLKMVHESLDEAKKPFIPRYYLHESANVKTWFEISSMERLTREEMNKIYVLSSGREIMSVINSSATVFRVALRK